jgi:hypothetical protein
MYTPNSPTPSKRSQRRAEDQYDEFHESLASPMGNASYRSEIDLIDTRPSMLGQFVQVASAVLIVLLAIRFIINLFSPDQFGAWTAFFYATTNWAVQPFLGLYNQASYIGTSSFVDWAALTAIVVTTLVAWVIITLLKPRPQD